MMPSDWRSRAQPVEPKADQPSEQPAAGADWRSRAIKVEQGAPAAVPDSPPSELGSAARGLFQGATSFFGDELVGYAKALGKGLTGSSEPVFETIKKGRNENRAANRAAEKANPAAYKGGEIVGAVASSLLPQGRIAKTIGGSLGKAGAWVEAAVTGATQGAGLSEGENAKEIAKDTGAGAAMGIAGKAVGDAFGALANKTGVTDFAKFAAGKMADAAEWTATKLPKKLLSAIGGVREENLSRYLAESEAVTTARPVHLIARDVANRIETLKNMVIEGSREATEKIPEKGEIRVDGIYKAFQEIMSEFEGAGGAGKGAKKAAAAIQGLWDDFNSLIAKPAAEGGEGVVANLRDVKTFIKAIDKEIKNANVRGTFMSPENVAKVGLRREIDTILKGAVPEYATAMKTVAEMAEALAAASAKFGRGEIGETLKTAARRETKDGTRQALAGLSRLTESDAQHGKDILTEVQRRHVLEAFYKDATNGAKGVLLGLSGVGGGITAIGSMLGIDVLIPTGAVAAVAGVTGALRDAYGPQVTKKILDGYVSRGPAFRDAVNNLAAGLMKAGREGPAALKAVSVPLLREFPQIDEFLRRDENKQPKSLIPSQPNLLPGGRR
jgi:ADP-ribose pyrophosphatase YjhB (NUDIX family)